MKQKLNFQIALGLLKARIKQSLVAAIGVTFGIAMFITLISFMTGLNKLLDGLIINRTAHVRLYNEIKPAQFQPIQIAEQDHQHFIRSIQPKDHGKEIYNARNIIDLVKLDNRVEGVAPKIITPVFFNAGTIEISGLINGVDASEENRLFQFSDNVLTGNFIDLDNVTNSVFLGNGLADKMMVGLGDMVSVTTNRGDLATLKVVGIFQVGLIDFDNSQSFASMETVQKLIGQNAGYITDIQIKLKDIMLAPEVALEYSKTFGVDSIDIQTANAQFETGSDVRMTISYAVGITLLIVAGFGIYNILNMLIYEKMDSIAILKATGFAGNDVKAIFISLSMVIGIVGGIFGLLLGYTLSVIVDNIPFITPALPRLKTFPVNYNPVYYVIGIVFALATTYIAGLFPARKAAEVDPVAIIRGK